MLEIVVALLLTWAALVVAGTTPTGQALRRMLIDWPAERLSRITRGYVMLAIFLFGGTGLLVAVLGHEGARIIAMGLPELASWITMFEVTAYLDAAVAVITAVSAARIAGLKAWVRTLPLSRPRNRAPRRRRTAQGVRKPAKDDEPARENEPANNNEPEWAVAA